MSNNENWQNQAWQQQQEGSQQPGPQQTQAHIPGQAQQGSYQPPQPQTQAYSGYQYQQPAQNKGKGWIVGLVTVILIFILCAIGLTTCSTALSTSVNSSLLGSNSTSLDLLTEDSIGVITIDGTIQYDGTTSSPEGLKAQLKKAEENSRIKAVVLRVNSGGGTATAGEEMTEYIKNFSKPVVVSSASINASAAYMISSQADYIYTAKTTSIGSIGTALQVTDLSGLYDKLGIGIENITSSNNKDAGYGTRALTDDERAYYQKIVDQINDTFIDTVSEGRSMDKAKVLELATGMTFTGMDAVKNGLADEIGTLDDACKKAASLAGITSYGTVALQQETSSLDWLELLGYASRNGVDVESTLKELEGNDVVTQ